MTLMYELDLKFLKMSAICTPKMNYLGQGFQKLEHYRHTDRPDRRHYRVAFEGVNKQWQAIKRHSDSITVVELMEQIHYR